ncbi:TPA: O108 family O-antigen polymerase, partial [Escherichia coli]|nr:O108 family O-antigen polymerase [Escherichia coli]
IGIVFWYFSASLSTVDILYDHQLQSELSLETLSAILLAGVFFVAPFVFSKKIDKNNFSFQRFDFNLFYRVFFNFIVALSVVAFFMRFGVMLTNPPLLSGAGSDLKSLVPNAPPLLNFIDVSMPYIALAALFELKYSYRQGRVRKYFLLSYVFFSIVVALVYEVSRGEFLVFMLGAIYIFLIPRKITLGFKQLMMVMLPMALLLYIGAMRISETSRASTQFGDGMANSLFSQIYTYVAMNFQNLNLLINSSFEPTYIWGGLKFILKPFFGTYYDSNSMGFTDYEVGFFNAKTFIYYFYNDLGLAGVILYSFIIGLLLQIIYNKTSSNIKYCLLQACFMKAIVFMLFGNYFFGEFVLIIPYLIVLFLLLLIRKVEPRRIENTPKK